MDFGTASFGSETRDTRIVEMLGVERGRMGLLLRIMMTEVVRGSGIEDGSGDDKRKLVIESEFE